MTCCLRPSILFSLCIWPDDQGFYRCLNDSIWHSLAYAMSIPLLYSSRFVNRMSDRIELLVRDLQKHRTVLPRWLVDVVKTNQMKHDITWEMKRKRQQQKAQYFRYGERIITFIIVYVVFSKLSSVDALTWMFLFSPLLRRLLFAQANNYLAIIIKIKWMRW